MVHIHEIELSSETWTRLYLKKCSKEITDGFMGFFHITFKNDSLRVKFLAGLQKLKITAIQVAHSNTENKVAFIIMKGSPQEVVEVMKDTITARNYLMAGQTPPKVIVTANPAMK